MTLCTSSIYTTPAAATHNWDIYIIGRSGPWEPEPSTAAMRAEAARQMSPVWDSEFLLQSTGFKNLNAKLEVKLVEVVPMEGWKMYNAAVDVTLDTGKLLLADVR